MLFANNESTDRLWSEINKISYKKFGISWQNYYNDIDKKYIIHSIMYNLKIILAPSSFTKTIFASINTFEPQDFISF